MPIDVFLNDSFLKEVQKKGIQRKLINFMKQFK